MQLLSRWYGFSVTFPGWGIYVARWAAGWALSRSMYAVKTGLGSSILKPTIQRTVPPKTTSAVVNCSPSSQGPSPMATSMVSTISS